MTAPPFREAGTVHDILAAGGLDQGAIDWWWRTRRSGPVFKSHSPRSWMLAGGNPQTVIELARNDVAAAVEDASADSVLVCTECARVSTTEFASSLRTGWER